MAEFIVLCPNKRDAESLFRALVWTLDPYDDFKVDRNIFEICGHGDSMRFIDVYNAYRIGGIMQGFRGVTLYAPDIKPVIIERVHEKISTGNLAELPSLIKEKERLA